MEALAMNPIMMEMMIRVKQNEMNPKAGKPSLTKVIQSDNCNGSRNWLATFLILSAAISLMVLWSITFTLGYFYMGRI
jgi:hypothetical protein